jgi:branched-chain amino acid aminotransferase
MIGTLAKHKAEAEGFDDALMYDWRGQVAEGTGANICFVSNGEVHTPTPDCFLDSITRKAVTALAHRHQIKVVERVIMPEELSSFSEAFLVGTAAEVTPVRQIGTFNYTPDRVTETLIGDYEKLVRMSPAEVAQVTN